MQSIKNDYNYQINGLRAILCVLIVLYHFFVKYSELDVAWFFPSASVVWGTFLVLSGYFLSYTDLKHYWHSKIFNTVIPYIISVILIFTVSMCVYRDEYIVSIKDFVMNILCLPMLASSFEYVDGAHWYIIYLVYFYCVFFIFNLISQKNKKILDFFMIAFGAACVVSMFLNAEMGIIAKVFRTLFTPRLIFLIMGYFWKNSGDKSYIIKRVLSFAFAEFYLVYGGIPTNALYFMLVILLFIGCEKEKLKFLNNPVFQIIGTNSLFIYLIHQNIGYMIIDSCSNYWVGAVLAAINAVAVGTAFGMVYKKILKLCKNKTKKKAAIL